MLVSISRCRSLEGKIDFAGEESRTGPSRWECGMLAPAGRACKHDRSLFYPTRTLLATPPGTCMASHGPSLATFSLRVTTGCQSWQFENPGIRLLDRSSLMLELDKV